MTGEKDENNKSEKKKRKLLKNDSRKLDGKSTTGERRDEAISCRS